MMVLNDERRKKLMIRQVIPIDARESEKGYIRRDMAMKIGEFLIDKKLVTVKEIYGGFHGGVEVEAELEVIAPEGWGNSEDAG